MRKVLILFVLSLFLFSCENDNIVICDSCGDDAPLINSELWIKAGDSIESLNFYFVGKDAKNVSIPHVVRYEYGAFTPNYKQFQDNKDGKLWTLVHLAPEISNEIVITYNGKEYKTRGFYLGERRFIEVSLTLSGDVGIVDYDITQIDQIVYID